MRNSLVLNLNNDVELKRYLSSISKIKILTEKEEQDLAIDWFENKNKDSAQKLVVSHLPLVVKVAYSYKGYGISIMDLISEGSIGLMKAVGKFDPYNGNRFSTYAMWWIKAYINDFILNSWSLVRSGTLAGRKKLFFSLNKLKNKLGINKSVSSMDKSEIKMIAEASGVSEKDVIEVDQMISNKDFYIDASVNDEQKNSIINSFESLVDNPEEALADKQQKKNQKTMVAEAFSVLNEREKYILSNRYNEEKAKSFDEIGKVLKISRERVRQIEVAAFNKIKALFKNKNIVVN